MASHFVTSADIPVDGEQLKSSKVTRWRRLSGIVSAIASLVSLFLLFGPSESLAASFSYSWLFAFYFFFSIALGGLFWAILHNVSNSSWGVSVRRVFENLGAVYPWMFLFAIPLLIPSVQKWLFEWMNFHREISGSVMGSSVAQLEATDYHPAIAHLLELKHWYLNIPFWYGRFFFYLIVGSLCALGLRKLSVDQDNDPNPGTSRLLRSRFHSSYMLPLFAILITFTAYDWLLGIDYTWFSTMWGVYIFSGTAMASMAAIIITVTLLQRAGYLKKVVTLEHFHVKGKLLYAFVIFWAYIAFSQYMLIWYANITEETKYFIIRNTGGWHLGNLILLWGHFVIPFVILCQAWLKKRPVALSWIAAYLLVMHIIDMYIIVIPERAVSLYTMANFGTDQQKEVLGHLADIQMAVPGAFFGDILAFVAIGSGFLYFYLRNLAANNLYPNRDPRILESANANG